jgi:hypothetical protein
MGVGVNGIWKTAAALGLAAVAGLAPARADETPFGSIYTTDTQPKGTFEFEQWAGWAWQKPHEDFRAFEGRSEIEYGITDHWVASLYANYSSTRIVPHGASAPDDSADETKFDGFSAETIYQVLDPYTHSIGLAFYLEPSYGDDERGLEGKILLQKNFLDDRLVFAANINLEYTWEHEDHQWQRGTAFEVYAGASYLVAPHWNVGVLLLNEKEYDGQLIFGSSSHVATAFYAGPAVHYSAEGWWATLQYLRQLPWGNGAAGEVDNGLVTGAERNRVLARIGVEL